MHNVLNSEDLNTVQMDELTTIYDAFLKAGIVLPHGCLSGSCGACIIQIEAGVENLSEPTTIEQNTIDAFYKTGRYKGLHLRLGCRVKVKGPVTFRPAIGN